MAQINKLQSRLSKHFAYRRTLRELRSLSNKVATDLDIIGSEKEIAYRAIYG